MHNKYFVSNKFNPAFGQTVYAFSAAEAKFIVHGRNAPKGTTAKIIK